jgi:hypothetical protein
MSKKKTPEQRMRPGRLSAIRRRAGKIRARSSHQIKPWWISGKRVRGDVQAAGN